MTTKAKHTPGPWVAEHSGTGDASVVCKCGWKNRDGTKFEPVLVKRIGWEDARLIAAAPYLLEALKGMVEAGHLGIKLNVRKREHYSWMVAESIARKAIIKAEGG